MLNLNHDLLRIQLKGALSVCIVNIVKKLISIYCLVIDVEGL